MWFRNELSSLAEASLYNSIILHHIYWSYKNNGDASLKNSISHVMLYTPILRVKSGALQEHLTFEKKKNFINIVTYYTVALIYSIKTSSTVKINRLHIKSSDAS